MPWLMFLHLSQMLKKKKKKRKKYNVEDLKAALRDISSKGKRAELRVIREHTMLRKEDFELMFCYPTVFD